MKKLVSLVLMGFAILAALVSCKKSEEIAPAQKEQIKIYMSVPQKSDGLKSGSVSEKQAIQAGDTVDVRNVEDINVILSAENEFGQALSGTWVIYVIDTDRNARDNTFVQNTPQNYVSGPMTSIKMTFLGLYKAEFRSKNSTDFICYIRHTGIPGSVGDDWYHGCAFRLNKETYQIVNDPGHPGYTLYMRYTEEESANLENSHALILGGGQYSLQKCKYSPWYVRVSFIAEEVPSNDGKYIVYFYFGEFGDDWQLFYYCSRSDWLWADGTITFQTI